MEKFMGFTRMPPKNGEMPPKNGEILSLSLSPRMEKFSLSLSKNGEILSLSLSLFLAAPGRRTIGLYTHASQE